MQLSAMSSHKQVMTSIRLAIFSITAIFSSTLAVADDDFPRAELVESRATVDTEYRLIISGLKRREAVTSGKVERLLNANLKRELWQLSSNHDVQQVMNHYLEQWAGGEVLYRCDGLSCGSSNFWANKIFNDSKLYGRDANQAYAVVIDAKEKNKIHVIYVMQRSKQTIYFNVDEVNTSDAVEKEQVEYQKIMDELSKDSGWLAGLHIVDGRIDEEKSAVLINILKDLGAGTKRRLYLVVHCYEANNMSDNFACSTRIAQQLRAAIYNNFEISVFGHGALTHPPGDSLKPQLRFMLWPR